MSKSKVRIKINDLPQKAALEVSEEEMKKIRGGKMLDKSSPSIFDASSPQLAKS